LGEYNYVISDSDSEPTNHESLRLDYSPLSRLQLFGRWQRGYSGQTGRSTTTGIFGGWQNGVQSYDNIIERFEVGATYSFNPHMVNQFSGGWTRWHEYTIAPASTLSQFEESTAGVNFPSPYPQNNLLGLLPAMSFTYGPSFGYDPRLSLDDIYPGWSLMDGFTDVSGTHQLKFGVFYDSSADYDAHIGNVWGESGQGDFSFSAPNPNNPYNTGNAIAEGLLGYFDSYTISNKRINLAQLQRDFEWYAQDDWRVTKRLTLNYGVRFSYEIPIRSDNPEGSEINFSLYSPTNAPPLFQPVLVNGRPMTQNPLTGAIEPAAYEGFFVPGVGNPAPGAVSIGNKPLFSSHGLFAAPRLGFAYSRGKTVVRGGFGMFYGNPTRWGNIYGNAVGAPTVFTPTQFYGQVANVAVATGMVTPSSQQYFTGLPLPYTMQYTLGIQREVGFKTVLGVGYVANVGRQLGHSYNINEVPYGAQFLPQNRFNGAPLPTVYYVPYPGYSSITEFTGGDDSNYNSLQVTLTRRFAHNLTYEVAYTHSKSMDENRHTTYLPSSLTYGPASFNRPNRLTGDWVWDMPKASRLWNNRVIRTMFDNWESSAIVSFISGTPSSVSCGTTTGLNITGGGDSYQCIMTGNPVLPKGQRTFNRYFNPSVYALPQVYTPGAPLTAQYIGTQWTPSFYGPGVNSWDMSFMKNIPLVEKVKGQLRADLFNAFNHASFTGVNTSAIINPTTGQQVNTALGQLNSDLGPRVIQVSVRINF
jgi:hypothetical protein